MLRLVILLYYKKFWKTFNTLHIFVYYKFIPKQGFLPPSFMQCLLITTIEKDCFKNISDISYFFIHINEIEFLDKISYSNKKIQGV